uniref:Uncharacterized protein n=1 Tax=virus sp. ctrcb4 TaxID=2825824 RepID=A0A8S5RP54_9VIRU|nr:MAG TPA: hypothetical protein [virus sp. ctrcb4]
MVFKVVYVELELSTSPPFIYFPFPTLSLSGVTSCNKATPKLFIFSE